MNFIRMFIFHFCYFSKTFPPGIYIAHTQNNSQSDFFAAKNDQQIERNEKVN